MALCLRDRSGDIERTILERIGGPVGPRQPEIRDTAIGRHEVVRAALEYALRSVELGHRALPPLPSAVIEHARSAGSRSAGLQTLMMRYLSAYSVFGDFVLDEVRSREEDWIEIFRDISQSSASALEHLIDAICAEYERAVERRHPSNQTVERVHALLAGHHLKPDALTYDFDCRHVALVSNDADAAPMFRGLAKALCGQLLVVEPAPGVTWGWIGLREAESSLWTGLARLPLSPSASFGIGEQGAGLVGWRRSHQQASAAYDLCLRSSQTRLRYSQVAVLASVVRDELLKSSLADIYLEPLKHTRDRGRTLRATLRAYFAAGRNGVSAAAALSVSRQTVAQRLQKVEELLGQPLPACAEVLNVALQLEDLGCLP